MLFQVDVYHEAQPHFKTVAANYPAAPVAPLFSKKIEAISAEGARLRLLKEHPEYSANGGRYVLDATKLY